MVGSDSSRKIARNFEELLLEFLSFNSMYCSNTLEFDSSWMEGLWVKI